MESLQIFLIILSPSLLSGQVANFSQLVKAAGYAAEEHTITTTDGYILTMFRIPSKGHPVLYVHGLMVNSESWILPGQNYSTPYQLVEAGYDAWFANVRGTKYGRKHTRLNPDKDEDFWKFSYDEMSQYDIPAFIDYVLSKTGKKKCTYVGFSQGTAVFYALGAYQPLYYDKIDIMISMASVTYMTHAKSPLLKLIAGRPLLSIEDNVGEVLGIHEFFRQGSTTNNLLSYICSHSLLGTQSCAAGINIIMGYDPASLRRELLPIIAQHALDGVSKQDLLHFGQGFGTDRFQKFDFGSVKNRAKYGSTGPPEYNLSIVKTPVAVILGLNDWLSNSSDVDRMVKLLPNLVEKYVVSNKLWSHIDHIWATDARKQVGEKVLSLINNHHSS